MRFPLGRPSSVVVVVFAAIALGGCKSLADYKKEVSAQMTAVDRALASASTLPICKPGAEASYLIVSDTTVIALSHGDDEYVATGASGVPNPCPGVSVDGQVVNGFANRFNPEGIRKAGAKDVLAAKGFAVVVVDEVTAPGPRGAGAASGNVVLVSGSGKAECRAPWRAVNGDRVSVSTDKMSVKLGFSPTDAAAITAWKSDLSTNSCNAITKAVPLTPHYPQKKK